MAQKSSSFILGITSVIIASILLTGCTLIKRQPVPLPLEPSVEEQGGGQQEPLAPEKNPSIVPSKSAGGRLPTAAPKTPTPTLGATDINSLEKDLGELELDSETF